MITGICGCGSLSKNGRFVTHICFSKIGLLKPQFLLCFGGAHVLGQVVKKKEFLDLPPQKNRRILTDNRNVNFLVFFG